jgi:hypothetical protein
VTLTWADRPRASHQALSSPCSTITGLPLASLPTSQDRQVIGMRMPSPTALLNASLAEKRVARKRSPRSGQRALRAFQVANSASLRIFCAKRSPCRSTDARIRRTSQMSVPMP